MNGHGPFRRLPLLAKMLVPFVALTVVVGVLGVLFVTRDLSRSAEDALDDGLARRVVEARSFLHERELYALESANYAANLQGMDVAIRDGDAAAVRTLLESVLVLKPDLILAVAAGADGVGIAELRSGGSERPTPEHGGRWNEHPFVAEALATSGGDRTIGTIAGAETPMVAVAAPVCAGAGSCEPVGVAIIAIPATSLLSDTLSEGEGWALFDPTGARLAARGVAIPASEPPPAGPLRRTISADDERIAVMYAPFSLRGRPAGTIAVAVPVAPAFAAADDAARRLVFILISVIAGIIVVATLLVRMITRQVHALVDTNRRLGGGDLSARADVRSGDEIGELAAGVNTMADQLQAAVETLELRVAERTDEIRRLLQQRTDFFASLSHEFRTPLAIILAQTDRLDDRTPGRNGRRRAEEITATIRESADQALTIVNDVLDLAKAERSSLELQIEPVDMRALIEGFIPTIHQLARDGEIDVEVDLPPSLPLVPADPSRVRTILQNLADNAIKYTPRGGRIRIGARDDNGDVVITVSDTGPGIPAEAADKLFEPFYRVPGNVPQHGRRSSGLGLALTRQLVEAHGGTISYHALDGGGTEFFVRFPAAP